MAYMQVVIEEADGGASGAELRNNANARALSMLGEGGARHIFRVRPSSSRPARSIAPTVRSFESGEIDRLLRTVEQERPDFVLIEGVALLDALRGIRQYWPDLPIVVDMHNVESTLQAEIDRSRLPHALRPLAASLHVRRWRRSEQADRDCAALATELWTCSEQDADLLVRLIGGPRPAVVPNPVPEWTRGCCIAGSSVGNRVLFVGHLGYRPNKLAVNELCRDIMPRLRKRLPSAQLHVCGRRPGNRMTHLIYATGHQLTPDPPDLAPIYAGASVTALPLREGGGTRIKVIEALSVGCPIVATAKAVEGLGLTPGQQYLQAEDARAFAEALCRVLAEPSLRVDLVEAGRAFCTRTFGDDLRRQAIAESLRKFLAR